MPNDNQSSGAITLVSGAGAGIKGPFVEVFPALLFDTAWLWVSLQPLPTGFPEFATQAFWDFAIGSPGSENVRLPDLATKRGNGFLGGYFGECYSMFFGLGIGNRLSMRLSDNSGARNYRAQVLVRKDQGGLVIPS